MEKNKTKKKAGIKGVLFSLIFSLIVFSALIFVEYKTASQFDRVKVMVAIKEIKKGEQIKKEEISRYFKEVSIDSKAMVKNALTDMDDITDMVILTDISENEQITASKYLDIKDYEKAGYSNPTEISCKVENLSYSVAGTLRRGNIVSIYGYDKDNEEMILIQENVMILGAYDGNGITIYGNEEGASVVFNLLLEKEELTKVINAFHDCTGITFVKEG